MSFADFVSDNFVMIFELIGILIMLGISVHIGKRTKRQTVVTVILLFIEVICFSLEKWSQTFEKLSILRPLMTSTVYTLYPLILFFITTMTDIEPMAKKWIVVLLVPIIVCVPLFYSSQWTHLVYYFTEDNRWTGGTLRYLPYILFGMYLVLFAVKNLLRFKNYSWSERALIGYIVAAPIIIVGVYLATGSEKDFSPVFTSAMLMYYMYTYIQVARTDPLTGLLNRQSYYHDLASGGITGVVSIDMNDLKYLNDNLGHAAGDEALRTVGSIMYKYAGTGRVFRVGGDEFMIIYHGASETDILEAVAAMQLHMGETKYVCAFGYAMHEANKTIEETIVISDQRMYENKAKLKGQRSV